MVCRCGLDCLEEQHYGSGSLCLVHFMVAVVEEGPQVELFLLQLLLPGSSSHIVVQSNKQTEEF